MGSRFKQIRQHLPRALGHLILRDPRGWRDVPRWAGSWRAGRNPLDDGVPWMCYPAVRWLEQYLVPTMKIFEFGSGGSTVFFARRVQSVVSVEHDALWRERVVESLARAGLNNVETLLRASETRPSPEPGRPFGSENVRHLGDGFESYARSIEAYPAGAFDLICIDGRARVDCGRLALSKLRPGGRLVLDDSDRPRYQPLIDAIGEEPRIDLTGIRPYSAEVVQTTVWEITKARETEMGADGAEERTA